MSQFLEVWSCGTRFVFPLDGDSLTVGRSDSNALAITEDPTVSRVHAIFQSYGSVWCIRDVGSSNGTEVNSKRIAGEYRLQSGDEITIGDSKVIFRSLEDSGHTPTLNVKGPPLLTRREHEVLIALCRPMLSGEPFSQPATVREIAGEFSISTEAVKFHLRNLYDKFGIYGTDTSKRVTLANSAVKTGAISRSNFFDLKEVVGIGEPIADRYSNH